MSSIQVIERGRRVRVGPGGGIDVPDVLDFVEALIEEHGWRKIDPAAPVESSDKTGYTLHDAIGQFGTRLATDPAAPEGTPRRSGRLSGGKDAYYDDPGADATTEVSPKSLRVATTALVERAIDETSFQYDPSKSAVKDQQFNDQAQNADEILAVVQRARELYEEEV